MATTNTDLTEEDAADLQFPKEIGTVPSQCVNCYYELEPPFIVCKECRADLCTSCFASGAEVGSHKNDHDYYVFDDHFILFEYSNWSAREELTMLDILLDYGSFDMVAKQLPNRSVNEIKEHYDLYYLQRKGSQLFPAEPLIRDYNLTEQVVPYRCRLSNIEMPPRYSADSPMFHTVAGYNPARSDFESEYDANAEDIVANLTFIAPDDPDHELLTSLQCGIVRSYNRRLLERQRRKDVIRNHGLILARKMVSHMRRYEMTVSRNVCDRLTRFLQFCTGMQFDYLMEGLHRAGELKLEILRLTEFRKKGIRTKAGARIYLKMKKMREDAKNQLKTFQNAIPLKFTSSSSLRPIAIGGGKKRRMYSLLDIVGLPGYERLNDKEQQLCQSVRLVPISYLEFKDILINESKKMGYLKLQTARRLLKIDVNKTRRIYDFLAEEGYIVKQIN